MNTLLWRGRANKSVWRSRSKTSHDDVAEVAEMQQSHDVKLTSSPCALNDDDDEDDNSIMPCVLHTAERLSSPREAVAAHPAAWPQHISADDLLDAPPMPRRRLTLSSSPTSCFLCGEGGDATVSFPQRSRGDDDDDRDDVDDDDDDDDDDLMEASTDPFMLCSEEVGSPCSLMDEGSGAPPLAAMSLTCCPQRTPRVCDEVLMVDGLHSATPPRGDDGDDVLRQLEESPLPHHHQRIFSGQVGDDLLDLVEVCSSTHTVSTEEVAGTSTTISCGRSLGATPRARDFLADGNRYNTIMSRRYNVSLAQSPATNTTTTNTTATSAAMMGRSTGAYVGTSTNTTNTGGMLPPLRLDVVAGRSTTFASCACDGPEEESEAAPSRGMLRKMPTSSSSTQQQQQQQQQHHHSTNCPAAAVAAATSSVMERYQQQEYLLPTPLATTDDHLRAGLYHLLLHPPSAQLGSTDACQRYFHALQMLCPHQRVGWERVRLLLQPGDLIHHGDLYPADFLLPFSEFLNFVEIASVRYRAQRMF